MDEANKKQPPGLPQMYIDLDSVDRELYMVHETLACLTQTWSDVSYTAIYLVDVTLTIVEMRSTSLQFLVMLDKAEKYRKIDQEVCN